MSRSKLANCLGAAVIALWLGGEGCAGGSVPDAGSLAEDAGTEAGKPDSGSGDGGFGSADGGESDGGDAGKPDSGSADASLPDAGGSRSWDGGSCAAKTDCPCFSSDDCAPAFWCHSEDDTGLHVYCIPGARGPGAAGATCTGEQDCQSALCIDSASAGRRCSALCDGMQDCPASLPKCLYVGFGVERSICAP